MGRKLTKLQKWILEHATERQARVDAGKGGDNGNRLYFADIHMGYPVHRVVWEPLFDIILDIHARHRELMGEDTGDLSFRQWFDLHDQTWAQTQKEFEDCPSWKMEYKETERVRTMKTISLSCHLLESQGLVTLVNGRGQPGLIITDAGREKLSAYEGRRSAGH